MIGLRESGFRAGYSDWTEAGYGPPKRLKLSEAESLVWLEAWAMGRTLAQRHRAEKRAAIERLE